jgi:hypothetical protein
LFKNNQYIKNSYTKDNGWEPIHNKYTFEMTTDQYFERFWSNNAQFGLKNFNKKLGYFNVEITSWK